MEFIAPALLNYCELNSQPESDLLHTLRRQTHLTVMSPRMLSGHLQGRFLAMLSKLIQPHCVLEIGTYTGYSALCLAEGLPANGKLITIDPNEETNVMAKKFFAQSAFSKQIHSITGDAATQIPLLEETFNLVFLDADKKSYKTYYELILPKVAKGGLIVVDNVLWSGKVITEANDEDTMLIKAFNAFVAQDPSVEALMLPLRDGITLLRKK